MKRIPIFLITLISILYSSLLTAQYTPYLDATNSLPIPNGKRLVFNANMSDEFTTDFNGKPNPAKWKMSDAPNTNDWIGRFPGHFDADAVSVFNGALRIEASVKNKYLQDYDGVWKTFTHQGGLVTSTTKGSYGYYEARIKANKTFMSSTFWLLSEDCSRSAKGTELDILETVGVPTKNKNGLKLQWVENYIKRMNYNTHGFGCPRTNANNVSNHGRAFLNDTRTATASGGFHIYGALWLNKDKVIFYLDGKKIGEVVPPTDFDLEMYLKMTVETYNWNQPDPGNDGMGNNKWQRSAIFDYVRAWKLEDLPTNNHFDGTEGFYTITARNTNKNISTTNFGVTIATPNSSDIDQEWHIKKIPGIPAYNIRSKSTGRYLEVSYAGCVPGNTHSVGTWTGSSQGHQQWTIDWLGNNILRLRPYHCPNKALTSWYSNPSNIMVAPINPGAPMSIGAQLFYIKKVPSRSSRKSLDTTHNKQELSSSPLEIEVYPNPVTGNVLNIDFNISNHEEELDITICDTHGRELLHKRYKASMSGNNIKIDLDNISITNGIYFLKAYSSNQEFVKIINIQR